MAKGARTDLLTLVAYAGSSVCPLESPRTLEAHVVRAVKASRSESALARMLPVFLWRMRDRLELAKLVRHALRQGEGPALGFFLETAAKLGRTRRFDPALTSLSRVVSPDRPGYFFRGTERRPFERMAAERATPAASRRWGLIMNLPWESFATYFAKTSRL